jgi:hypothetical protein
MWASCAGELDAVRQLLEAGADADILDKVQHALLFLHYCVICYFDVTCIIGYQENKTAARLAKTYHIRMLINSYGNVSVVRRCHANIFLNHHLSVAAEAKPTGSMSSVLSLFTTKKTAAHSAVTVPVPATASPQPALTPPSTAAPAVADPAVAAKVISERSSAADATTPQAPERSVPTPRLEPTSPDEELTDATLPAVDAGSAPTPTDTPAATTPDKAPTGTIVSLGDEQGSAVVLSAEGTVVDDVAVSTGRVSPDSIQQDASEINTPAEGSTLPAVLVTVSENEDSAGSPSPLQYTQADRAAVEEFQRSTRQLMRDSAQLQHVVLRVQAHDYTLHMLVNKLKECPSLFWFYPKKRELRTWLSNPAKCLFQDTLMMVVVCPVTLCVVPCGPGGVGWEVALPKKWVKEWGPAILFSIYVLQAAVVAGRVVGIPLPPMPDTAAVKEALGLKGMLGSAFSKGVNQANLSDSLSSFAETTKEALDLNPKLQSLWEGLKQPTAAAEGGQALPAHLPMHLVGDAYKSIHTYLTTGENSKLGKLEDQLRGRMERVMAPDGDIEWVSVEGKEAWLQKHATIVGPPDAPQQALPPVPQVSPAPAVTTSVVPVAVVATVLPSAANSWLAVKLAERGMAPAQVAVCESVLVEKEGFYKEESLATLPATEFDLVYLRSVGISARGTANELVALHRELHAQYFGAFSPTPGIGSAADTATLTPDEKTRILDTVQSLTAELQKLRAATTATSQQQQQSGGGGGGKGGLMQKQAQCNVVNPHTKQPYTMDELVTEIHLLQQQGARNANDIVDVAAAAREGLEQLSPAAAGTGAGGVSGSGAAKRGKPRSGR